MAKKNTSTKARRDIQQDVTDKIVAALESGTVPWVKPWSSFGGAGSSLDRNAVSNKHYNGVNLIVLWMARSARGWESNRWVTFNQAKKALSARTRLFTVLGDTTPPFRQGLDWTWRMNPLTSISPMAFRVVDIPCASNHP